jgi:cysteine desulfurase
MVVKTPIYLDNNATTRIDPRVLEAMMPYLTDRYGNAASRNHSFGYEAEAAVEAAREQVAAIMNAGPKDIVWTSGATESDNLAIKGVAEMYGSATLAAGRENRNHIVTCKTEHKAVIDTCKYLETKGYEVTWLDPDRYGRVSPQQVAEAITGRTILVTLMAANNEIGTLHPIAEVGKVTRAAGVFFHTDATQAVGKVPIDVEAMGIDLLSMSGHKIYGPKGIGAIYVRRRGPRVRLACQMHGGGHESGMRSGTLNVPGIVGFGAACEIAAAAMPQESARLTGLRDRLHKGLADRLDYVTLNGHPTERLPNTLNMSFAYVEGESLMMKMSDVAVSSGSACTSASLEPSFVLRAIGVPDELAHSSIRFSLGRYNNREEIDYVIERVVRAVNELRELSPLYELAQEGKGAGPAASGQQRRAAEAT